MKLALPILLALFVGLALGYTLFSSDPVVERGVGLDTDVEVEGGGALGDVNLAAADDDAEGTERSSATGTSGAARDGSDRVEVVVEEAGLFSDALLAHARDGLRDGWADRRGDAMPDDQLAIGMAQFEDNVLTLPWGLGHQLAHSRTKAEALAADAGRGGAFALLATLLEGDGAPLPELVGDAAAFEELFVREHPEAPMDASGHEPGADVPDGSTLNFPAGCFRFKLPADQRGQAPADLSIAGAGMDATLLVLSDDLGSRGDLQRLELRDCTVFTNGHYLFDHRQGAATVVLERVRVIGFDSGAGSSCCFSLDDGVALLVRDSIIAGGYGRSPASGKLFDQRNDALLARFENSSIERMNLKVSGIRSDATVVFASCDLLDIITSQPLAPQIEAHAGVQLIACRLEEISLESLHAPESNLQEGLVRDLNDLFPDWQTRLQ
ncbi:hypothetical protein Pla163_00670 [Planctomycetes bacterium Pla163]|uniref:Uncharacterized protein n=1 Tax=Rohdeia mirabilis TaxID=2528008 RepID=A0A518CUS7_9BACT|nr:hypothetical protein Pla163_00670 [Planctomycetes bacterium Pla163]